MQGKVTRDVDRVECHWLRYDFKVGDTLYKCLNPTYGVVSDKGCFCTLRKDGDGPGFEFPRDAVRWENETVQIDNWSIVSTLWSGMKRDPKLSEFIVVENGFPCLHGKAFNHPDVQDGNRVLSTPIKSIDGNRVITQSGRVYKLGDINPEYESFLETIGVKFPTFKTINYEAGL